MLGRSRQIELSVMLGMGLAGVLCAQQNITSGEAARLQRQFNGEMRELQTQMEVSQRERQHVVKDAAALEVEVRKQQEAKRKEPQRKVDPRSPGERAKLAALLAEVNAQLPEMNASLKQSFSNSTLQQVALKPLKGDDIFSTAGGVSSPGKLKEQQALSQMMRKRIEEEMKHMDPQARNQMKKMLKAAEHGKPIPLPPNVPPVQRAQLLPKGTP